MNSKLINRFFIIVLVLLFVALIFSAKEANSILSNKSAELVKLKAQDIALTDQQNQLVQDNKNIKQYSSLNQIAESVVPIDKDQAETVREIVDLASQSGIGQLSSIAFPPSTLGGASITTSNGLTQVSPVKGDKGVYDLKITITQDADALVSYNNFLTFLQKLEANRRTALVDSINVQPDQKSPGMVAFTIVVDEYIKP
jgi:hypothetical protein